ncbi:MAG TPA: hypothetical protein VMF62_11965 [Acetobacteraceae bacterium]|jgi:hypothetical protein|nr:hypothetical protein [Acetobacteraceae bacterium]
MRTQKSKLVETVFVLVVFATFAGVAVRAVGEEVRALAPGLGDIVSFANVPTDPGSALVLTAERAGAPGGRTCVLDTAVMAKSGGSLFVEAGNPAAAGRFSVHWAGGATSAGPADCGRNAELLLSANQLQELASSVGGFGAPTARRADLPGEATEATFAD